MRKSYFKVFERNEEICIKANILHKNIIQYDDPNYVGTFQ